jgi:hypothetical protein
MKETKYSKMSEGRTGGMLGSSIALISRSDSTSVRLGGSHSSPGKGFDPIVSLKYEYLLWNFV